jgi:hypothetical protein
MVAVPLMPKPSGGTDGQVLSRQASASGGVAWATLAPQVDYSAALAATPDALVVGAVPRDGNGAATSAAVLWPDGATGTYTTLVASTAFPGAVDSYKVTHVLAGVTKTYTQPAVTRDASGAVTNRPAMTVA